MVSESEMATQNARYRSNEQERRQQNLIEGIEDELKNLKDSFKALEGSVEKLESSMDSVSQAIELIKTYGFQPNQFEELLSKHKLLEAEREGNDQLNKKYEDKETQLSANTFFQPINPIDKLQLLLLAVFVSLISSFIIAKMLK